MMQAKLAPAGKLTPVREEGGFRHYLNGEPVHAGDTLELQLADRSWLRGRFEASGRSTDASFHWRLPIADRPRRSVDEALEASGGELPEGSTTYDDPEASMWLPPWATLRWPEKGR
jgi:hypothetical protein